MHAVYLRCVYVCVCVCVCVLVTIRLYIYTVNDIITDCIRGIKEEGMPVYRHPDTTGNLYIKFEIEFPENGSLTEKSIVVSD